MSIERHKGTFLYSMVSSPWDCSKRFTLHLLELLADLFCSLHFTSWNCWQTCSVLYTSPPGTAGRPVLFFTLHLLELLADLFCSLHFTSWNCWQTCSVLYTSPPGTAGRPVLFFTLHLLELLADLFCNAAITAQRLFIQISISICSQVYSFIQLVDCGNLV